MQEAVGDTLEELWISYNMIEKLKGLNVLKKLKVICLAVITGGSTSLSSIGLNYGDTAASHLL